MTTTYINAGESKVVRAFQDLNLCSSVPINIVGAVSDVNCEIEEMKVQFRKIAATRRRNFRTKGCCKAYRTLKLGD